MTLRVLTGHTRCIDLSASAVLVCVLLCVASSCYSFYVRSCCCVCRLRQTIRAEYMQGWFTCDVISLLPYDLFSWLLEGSMQQEGSSVIQLLRIVRLLRLGKVSSFSCLSVAISVCLSASEIKGAQDQHLCSCSFSDFLSASVFSLSFASSLSLILFACLCLGLYISMTLCLFASIHLACTNKPAWCRC